MIFLKKMFFFFNFAFFMDYDGHVRTWDHIELGTYDDTLEKLKTCVICERFKAPTSVPVSFLFFIFKKKNVYSFLFIYFF